MIIYKATCLINGKVYIGQTVQSLRERRKTHERNSLNNKLNYYFCNALRKYGLNNFKWKIIDQAKTEEELNQLEQLYIADYKEKGKLYNLTNGGGGTSGFVPSKKSRIKMSIAKKGNKHCLGHKASEATKKKMSEARKGKHPTKETKIKLKENHKGMNGKYHSEKTRKKMSKAHKGNQYCLGHKHTEEHKRKISEGNKGEKHHFYGKQFSDEHRRKLSEAHMGQIPWNKGKKGKVA